MSPVRVEAVTTPLQLGEGPHWVEAEEALYFVDLLAGGLHRYHPGTNTHTSTKPSGGRSLSLTVPIAGAKGKHIVGHGRDLSVLSWDGVSTQCKINRVLATVDAQVQTSLGETRLNDGKSDPTGRLWAGTMSTAIDNGQPQPRHGNLYSLEDGGKRAQLRVPDIEISNGLAWNNDIFYYIDSNDYRVDAFNFNASTGDVSNRRCVFDFKKNGIGGVPDGMTIDTAGNLWVAVFGGTGQLLCIDPSVSKLVTEVKIPALQVTSAAWGGRNLDELYVTSAGVKAEAGKPQAGVVFRVTGLGAKGLSATEVKLDQKILAEL